MTENRSELPAPVIESATRLSETSPEVCGENATAPGGRPSAGSSNQSLAIGALSKADGFVHACSKASSNIWATAGESKTRTLLACTYRPRIEKFVEPVRTLNAATLRLA